MFVPVVTVQEPVVFKATPVRLEPLPTKLVAATLPETVKLLKDVLVTAAIALALVKYRLVTSVTLAVVKSITLAFNATLVVVA